MPFDVVCPIPSLVILNSIGALKKMVRLELHREDSLYGASRSLGIIGLLPYNLRIFLGTYVTWPVWILPCVTKILTIYLIWPIKLLSWLTEIPTEDHQRKKIRPDPNFARIIADGDEEVDDDDDEDEDDDEAADNNSDIGDLEWESKALFFVCLLQFFYACRLGCFSLAGIKKLNDSHILTVRLGEIWAERNNIDSWRLMERKRRK